MGLGAAAGRSCSALAGSNSRGVTGYRLSWAQPIHFYGLMLAVIKCKEGCECQGWIRRRASSPGACTALPVWPRKATYSVNGAPLLPLLFPAEPQFSYLELSPLVVFLHSSTNLQVSGGLEGHFLNSETVWVCLILYFLLKGLQKRYNSTWKPLCPRW